MSLCLKWFHFILFQVYMNGVIKGSTCECPWGDYMCSRVAALIAFSIPNISRTDVECKWRQHKLAAEVTSVEMTYRSLRWLQSPDKSCERPCTRLAEQATERPWTVHRNGFYHQNLNRLINLLPHQPSKNLFCRIDSEMKVDFILEHRCLIGEQCRAAEVNTAKH